MSRRYFDCCLLIDHRAEVNVPFILSIGKHIFIYLLVCLFFIILYFILFYFVKILSNQSVLILFLIVIIMTPTFWTVVYIVIHLRDGLVHSFWLFIERVMFLKPQWRKWILPEQLHNVGRQCYADLSCIHCT